MGRLSYYYCQSCDDYSTVPDSCEHEREFIFSEKLRRNLSKFLSYIFRHNPARIGIELDSHGFSLISLDKLIELIKKEPNYHWINKKVLIALVFLDHKGRFEIKDDKFRARYGHSLKNIAIGTTKSELPELLFHGTNLAAYQRIQTEGIRPMGRNLVHLTSSLNDAKAVGRRHKGKLVLLEIDVKTATLDNIEIWQAGKNVYVASYIPASYITLFELKD